MELCKILYQRASLSLKGDWMKKTIKLYRVEVTDENELLSKLTFTLSVDYNFIFPFIKLLKQFEIDLNILPYKIDKFNFTDQCYYRYLWNTIMHGKNK